MSYVLDYGTNVNENIMMHIHGFRVSLPLHLYTSADSKRKVSSSFHGR